MTSKHTIAKIEHDSDYAKTKMTKSTGRSWIMNHLAVGSREYI